MRFQGLAVVLAKQKWPDLIASERKNDLGLDAYAPALLAQDEKGRALACSLTDTLEKIKGDVTKICKEVPDVQVLTFATPRHVSNQTKKAWAGAIKEAFGIDLFVVSREDIITDLMQPTNTSLCSTFLRIPVAVEATLEELLQKTRVASSEAVSYWLVHSRLAGKPLLELQGVKIDQEARETGEIFELSSLHTALLQSRRIVLEAPAGGGKTTTLVQLAAAHGARAEIAFLVDLPAWVRSASRFDLPGFLARMPAYLSRGVHAEDLANICANVPCSFLLNGWNEISESDSDVAVSTLRELERNFPKAGIIVATRTHRIQPPLPGSFRIRLSPLSRAQRADYLPASPGKPRGRTSR